MEQLPTMDNKKISIENRTYELVDRHRPENANDSRIYKGHDSFVRIGPASTIEATIVAHKRLEAAGFPVPSILQTGTIGNEKYFIEESFGDKTYRLQFAEETAHLGHITEESFRGFMQIMQQYLNAQSKSPVERDSHVFFERTHIDRLCAELPEHALQIKAKAAKHFESLSTFPFVLSHGDLSPNNLFSKGVIDLEDALPAPLGYDAVCALMTTDWYPENEDFEFEVTPYYFTPSQRTEYLSMCDKVSEELKLPLVSDHLKDLSFFRAAWLTEGMGEWPKTQKYRHERFIKEYLS